jgi:hypothetical protein
VNAVALLAAAASWSAPQTVSAPHTFAGPLFSSNDGRGGALVAWGWQDDIGQNAPTGSGLVTAGAGGVSSERRGPDGLVAAQAYGNGRSLLLANRQIDRTGQRWRLTVKDGSTTTRLATAFILFRPQLSVAPDGSAIVAWVELRNRHQLVKVATRNRRGHFSRAVVVSTGGQHSALTTAISKRGDALVAFVRSRRVVARLRRPGASWSSSRADVLAAAHVRTTWQLAAMFDNTARAELGWRRHRLSRPGHPGTTPLRAVTAGPSARRWSRSQSLEPDGARDPVLTQALPSGLVLSYVHGPNSAATPRVRVTGTNGRFGQSRDAAAPQGGVRSVSAIDDGAAGIVVGWIIPNPAGDGGGIGYAAAEPFATREQVTPNEAAFDMRLVQTATGVRAFWTARPEGTGPSVPVNQVHTVVRTALRLPQGS